MADQEVLGSASPAPSDHKRKLDDLDSEPLDQPPVSGDSNGNSQSVTADADVKRPRIDGKGDGSEAADNGHQEEVEEEPQEEITELSDVVKSTESEEGQEKVDEPLDVVPKASVTDEPLDPVNKESVTDELVHKESVSDGLANKEAVSDEMVNKESATDDSVKRESASDELVNNESVSDKLVNKEYGTDETYEKVVDQEYAENLEEPAKVEQQGYEVEQDPNSDVAVQDDTFGFKDQSAYNEESTSRRMDIPSNKVGVLIGKAGDTIRTLQYSSGARIQITRDAEVDPNAPTRAVQLIGSIECINKAERLVKEVIAEAEAGGSPSMIARGFSGHPGMGEQIHMQVPNEKVGVIIGKGGENIKNLQSRSGARIQLIPQHVPEGDQSKERTVRITGDRRQVEMAKEMIKEVMDQPSRYPPGGNNQQNFRPRGSGGSQWGPRGGHPPPSPGYNNYPPRGGYSSQNPPYPSQGYGNYPPQQPPPRNNYGWDQRPPANKPGPPDQAGYDYYNGQGGHNMSAPSQPPPMHSHPPGPAMGPPPYNYGPPQGPDYGPPPSYPQTAPQGGYGQGYGEPRYDHQAPGQHPYGQGNQPPAYAQGGAPTYPGYGQQDQYNRPPAYNMPPSQGPYGQPYAQQPPRQPYPAAASGPMQQGYPQYGAPPVNDGYGVAPPGGYGLQGGPPASGYGPTGGQQPAPGYVQPAPTGGYSQYPSAQPGYNEQPPPASAGYGYQGAPDPAYSGGPGMGGYGPPPPVQPAYSQPAPAPAPAPVQPGYDQSVPQTGGYAAPQPQPQVQQQQQPPGYGQYDGGQMYAGHR